MRNKHWLHASMMILASAFLFGCSFSSPSSLDLKNGDFLLLYSKLDQIFGGESELVVIDQNGKKVSESTLPIQDLYEIEPLPKGGYALIGNKIAFLDPDGNIDLSASETDSQTFVYKETDDLTYQLIYEENGKEAALIKDKTGEKRIPLKGALTDATHDSNHIYVSASDVLAPHRNLVHIIDRNTNSLSKTLPLSEKTAFTIIDMILFHNHLVMVTDLNKFYVMDITSQTIETYDFPFSNELRLKAIADGNDLYFINDSGDVVVFDNQFKQIRHHKVKKGILTSQIRGDELYLLYDHHLQIADKKTLTIKKEIPVPHKEKDIYLHSFIVLDK